MRKNSLDGFESLEKRMVLADLSGWNIDSINLSLLKDIKSVQTSVVAIIDSGADIQHEFLKNNIWNNPYDLPDGIDNDNNGYVDDVNGWNFNNNTSIVMDGYGHGTHVAGIVRSLDPSVKIMVLKFQDDKGLGYSGDAIKAMQYLIDMKNKGINIVAVNCSWGGGTGSSSLLEQNIKQIDGLDINVVTAAGNSSSDNDITPRYPSNYRFQNTISVAASTVDGSLAGFSNYGKTTVDIAAPGTSILSSLPNGSYGYLSGTSMATPMVTGSISLLRSLTGFSSTIVKEALLKTGTFISGLVDKVANGLINVGMAYSRLMGIQNINPITPVSPPVVNLESNIVGAASVVNRRNFSGWTMDLNHKDKILVVTIKVNNRVAAKLEANQNRNDMYNGHGFSVNIHKKFFSQKKNLVKISVYDPISNKNVLIDKRWVNR